MQIWIASAYLVFLRLSLILWYQVILVAVERSFGPWKGDGSKVLEYDNDSM